MEIVIYLILGIIILIIIFRLFTSTVKHSLTDRKNSTTQNEIFEDQHNMQNPMQDQVINDQQHIQNQILIDEENIQNQIQNQIVSDLLHKED